MAGRTKDALVFCLAVLGGLFFLSCSSINAQELEIRRWNQLPVDRNFLTLNYGATTGDIAFDPVLQIENARFNIDTWLAGYVRTFAVFDKTARIEIRQPYSKGTWNGLVAGVPTTIHREGLNDTFMRLAINFIGGPPLAGKAYAEYRAKTEIETIVGAALGIQFPTGNYLEDKLINLGSNRFTFRPQIGMQQKYYNWAFELTGTVFLYSDNTSFFGGNRLEQEPLLTIDGSIEYDFPGGAWLSTGIGYGAGGASEVNNIAKKDYRQNLGWSLSGGFPITPWLGFKANYIGVDTIEDVGTRSNTFSIGLLATW